MENLFKLRVDHNFSPWYLLFSEENGMVPRLSLRHLQYPGFYAIIN
jgi:hypothetical protein